MAEEEGFEPPIPFQVRQFSRLEPSTTRPLFRTSMINHARRGRRYSPGPAGLRARAGAPPTHWIQGQNDLPAGLSAYNRVTDGGAHPWPPAQAGGRWW